MTARPLSTLLALSIVALGAQLRAGSLDEGRIQLRVMAASVPVRAGPGGSFRELGRVGAGQVYTAIDRSPDGAWYRIRLTRGTTGWVLAELVWPFEIVDESALAEASDWLHRNILGPSRLADGNVGLSISGGALGGAGFFALRLAYQPSRHYLLELSVGQSAGGLGNVLTYRGELLVTLGPWRSVVPFAAIGAGGGTFMPHRNVEIFKTGTRALLSAGGGLIIQLRGSVAIRFDARHLILFTPDDSWSALALLGGAMMTF